MGSSPPRFYYFDLGNVLLHFDHQRAARQMAEVADVSVESVWETVFESDLEWRFESGELSEIEFHEHFCRATGSKAKMALLARAAADIFTLNEAIVPLVSGLHAAGHSLGILSNTNRVHWDFVSGGRYGVVADYFRIFALSFEIGAMKPDAAIYDAAVQIAGVPAEHIFFVDDRPENVAGAKNSGFDAVQFTTAAQLRHDLAARGIQIG